MDVESVKDGIDNEDSDVIRSLTSFCCEESPGKLRTRISDGVKSDFFLSNTNILSI